MGHQGDPEVILNCFGSWKWTTCLPPNCGPEAGCHMFREPFRGGGLRSRDKTHLDCTIHDHLMALPRPSLEEIKLWAVMLPLTCPNWAPFLNRISAHLWQRFLEGLHRQQQRSCCCPVVIPNKMERWCQESEACGVSQKGWDPSGAL